MADNGKYMENENFLGNGTKRTKETSQGVCYSRHMRNCCLASSVLGALFLLLGIAVITVGEGALRNIVLKSMALKPGSDRYKTWLVPPVQPHLTGYAFHVTNPDEVVMGKKPILQEVGPFVYSSVTVKDSRDNLVYNEDGETLTYRPRKFYYYDSELSSGDPDKTYITVPNIPLISALSSLRNNGGMIKSMKSDLITKEGLGSLFINVTFNGLLWGYEDSLPCLKMNRPAHCPAPPADVNVGDSVSDWNMEEEEGDDWMRRQKRAVSPNDLREGDFEGMVKPKGGFVNCTCNWGLFRDRNVTLREPVTMYHGMSDLKMKGWVKEYNSKTELNWWAPKSQCDEVGGQDGGTLYPGLDQEDSLDIFIDLMCRRIQLEFEKETQYREELTAYRFIPAPNAMGAHDDPDPFRRNEENRCYCLKEDGFKCLKSGVLNMAPCKRSPDMPEGVPLAVSYPHFYQAHPDYLKAVDGLSPDKEKHQFFVDVAPEFGFPLAIRPRFQLNLIIQKDEDIPLMENLADELVLPFLWAQDGFDQPSEEMAKGIRMGLDIPAKLSMLAGLGLLAVGGVLLATALVWFLWQRRNTTTTPDTIPMN